MSEYKKTMLKHWTDRLRDLDGGVNSGTVNDIVRQRMAKEFSVMTYNLSLESMHSLFEIIANVSKSTQDFDKMLGRLTMYRDWDELKDQFIDDREEDEDGAIYVEFEHFYAIAGSPMIAHIDHRG